MEISRAKGKSAREPLDHRIQTVNRQLSQITGTTALEGIVDYGQELRERWDVMHWDVMRVERQPAIVAAVLDHAVINPAEVKGGKFDPNRIVPVWNL